MRNFFILMSTITALAASTLTSCTKCGGETPSTSPGNTTSTQTKADITDLKVETLKAGSGTVATSGKKVTVHYTGTLTDGRVFDSSETRQAPFTFILGAGQVIPGWDKGVEGMKIGERRRLSIPAALAYGEKGAGSIIPPNSPLIFEVELLNVE